MRLVELHPIHLPGWLPPYSKLNVLMIETLVSGAADRQPRHL